MIFCRCCGSLIDATDTTTVAQAEARYAKSVVAADGKVVQRCWCPICASNPANAAECAAHEMDEKGQKQSMFVHVPGRHGGRDISYNVDK